MTTKKILFAGGAYIPAAGGSELSIHELLVQFNEMGHQCRVLTRKNRYPDLQFIDDIEVRRIPSSDLMFELSVQLETFQPDVIFTQLMWSPEVLKFCKENETPIVYFVHSTGGSMDLSVEAYGQPMLIVSNSPFAATFVESQWHRHSLMLYPTIDLSKYRVERDGSLITMVNTVFAKGAHIFRNIALAMPERSFKTVRGWDHLRSPTYDWDMELMTEMAAAFDDAISLPIDIDLGGIDNLMLEGPFSDMREVYQRTRLLLVPSIWDEAFGRVAVEAMCCGIPVIASDRGNLRDTVGQGGIIIDDVNDVSAWVQAISYLDDESVYDQFSQHARNSASRFGKNDDAHRLDQAIDILLK